MAGDSKVTDSGLVYQTDKIFLIDGYIVGVCGETDYTNRFLDWFTSGRPEGAPSLGKKSFAALALSPEGLFLFSDCCRPDPLHNEYYAIGAGAMAAMAAMALGHSPEIAVEIACKVNNDSGPPVKVLALTPARRKR